MAYLSLSLSLLLLLFFTEQLFHIEVIGMGIPKSMVDHHFPNNSMAITGGFSAFPAFSDPSYEVLPSFPMNTLPNDTLFKAPAAA